MIDLSVQTKALEALLKADSTLSSCTIERSTRINFNPGNCPWIGVYPANVSSAPKTLGGGSARWSTTGAIQMVIQTMTYDESGTAAGDELETLINTALGVINTDLTLGVSGTRVVGVAREYRYVVFDDDESGSLFMPQVVIKLELEVRSA